MKAQGIKATFKNRSIFTGVNENNDIVIEFNKLIKDYEIEDYIINPTCKMEIDEEMKIVKTYISMSLDAAIVLSHNLKKLIENINEYSINK